MIRYGGGERDNFTLFGFRPDVIDKDVQSPLMNGSALFSFCSKVVRLTTMMVDPADDLENLHLARLDDIGQMAFLAFL